MTYSRRQFIQTLGIGSAGLLLPALSTTLMAKQSGYSFTQPYAVPPLDTGKRLGNQVTFNLDMRPGKATFFKGYNTSTLGINGNYLGPVLRARKGDTVSLNVHNRIGGESTLHWHGFTLPAEMDGGPHQRIAHGKTWNATFQIRQPASTLWYHSHEFHNTGAQVYQGLAGLFYVDDEYSSRLGIPANYGVDDLPVVIQDRAFNRNGEFRYLSMMPERMQGMHGDTILVNGVVTPNLKAQKTLIRLRLLNGSNARIYNLAFDDNRPFHVIASDCSLLSSPVRMNRLVLAPGERAEILLDLSDRRPVILKSLKGTIRTSGMMGMMMGRMGFDRELDIMRIDPSQAETSHYKIPGSLIHPAKLNRADAVRSRPMKMNMAMMGMGGGMGIMRRGGMGMMNRGGDGGGFTINGQSMNMNRINIIVKRGTSEIWVVSNSSPLPHPFHVHNVQFQVLSRNGRKPLAHETGLKDTVRVNPDETVSILVPFRYYADRNRPYMYHCHNLEHEDQGMMGQFTVV